MSSCYATVTPLEGQPSTQGVFFVLLLCIHLFLEFKSLSVMCVLQGSCYTPPRWQGGDIESRFKSLKLTLHEAGDP